MRLALRALILLAVFLGVGYGTMHLLVAHAVARGAPEYSVRLGGAMGGLFVGGAATVLAGLVMLLAGRSHPTAEADDESQPANPVTPPRPGPRD